MHVAGKLSKQATNKQTVSVPAAPEKEMNEVKKKARKKERKKTKKPRRKK